MRFFLLFTAILFLASCSVPVISPREGSTKKVVFVHGFLETGNSLRYMSEQLEKSGYECQLIRLRPSDGRGGLERLAESMKRDVETRFGTNDKISIVAFSMGGIVSRYYLQELGGAARCTKLITISSPHHGTVSARLYPTKGSQQMRPGSDFLQRLEASEHELDGISCLSCRTPFDLIILPPDSSLWQRAENRSYPILLHPFMLTSRVVIMDVQQHLSQPDFPVKHGKFPSSPARR